METDRTTQAPASTAPGWMTGPMATPPEIAMRSGRAIRFDDIFAWRIVGAPWLSPDGTRVVAEVQSIDQRSDEYRAALWLFPLDGAPRQLTTGRYADTAPRSGSSRSMARRASSPPAATRTPRRAGRRMAARSPSSPPVWTRRRSSSCCR